MNLEFTFKLYHTLGLNNLGKGIKPGLNRNEAYILPVAIPPLAEQHRIVTKVDELMALCDQLEQQTEASISAHQTLVKTLLAVLTNASEREGFNQAWARIAEHFDTLFITEWSIDQLKQTILQLAVMGKLVPQNPNDEPASVLLEKTITEKEHLIKHKLIRSTKAPAHSKEKPNAVLPATWVWSNLYEIGEIGPRNDEDDGDVASFVSMPLISAFYGVPVKHEVRQWKDIKSGFTHFKEQDVVLAKITPCFQNGKSAVMLGLTNGFGAGTTELHVYRSINSSTVPEYVLVYLKSPVFIAEGIPKMTGTAGQKRITRDYFAGNYFPLPPFEEQKRIVAKVNELMAICNIIKSNINSMQTTQLHLADAMAAQALS